MGNLYEFLNINKDAKESEIERAINEVEQYYKNSHDKGFITDDDYKVQRENILRARKVLLNQDERRKYDDYLESCKKSGKHSKGTKVVKTEDGKKASNKAKGVLAGITAALVAVAIMAGVAGYSIGGKKKQVNVEAESSYQSNLVGSDDGGVEETPSESVAPSSSSSEATSSSSSEQVIETPQAIDYGNINDEELLQRRASALVGTLNAAGITNISTGVPYTTDEIISLIKYANGIYIPESTEEIDILHLNLLNLLISPLNTDAYLYHVVYASGDNGFTNLLEDPVRVDFAEAFAEYGENGVYPLIEWIQEKRFQIYSSTNRDEINSIYREVGQVMADLMKGDGATITYQDDKEEVTKTFTSEQVLANHSSAMLLTTEAQLIFANHYQMTDENGITDSVSQEWTVYNKLNRDEQGNLIPDTVDYDEINAWINNGCDYEWGIDDVLLDGQTFGQRIQGDMEGMALNNYTMKHDSKSLTK